MSDSVGFQFPAENILEGHEHSHVPNGLRYLYLGDDPTDIDLNWRAIGGTTLNDPDVSGWGFDQSGAFWFNTTLQEFRLFDGDTVISLGPGGDHGALAGLGDDDHPQYHDGSLPYTGSLGMGTNDIINVGLVDGIDISALSAAFISHTLNVANPHSVDLQQAYLDAITVPQIDVTNGSPLTIDLASGTGDIFAVRDAGSIDKFRVDNLGLNFGQTTRRIQRMEQVDSTGRFGTELYPDDFSITTATGVQNAAFFSQSARTITLNIPGGGGLGNETAPAGMSFNHTVRFEDTGFLFASQLLINAAVQVECATAAVGPLYLFLDQYNTYADGVVATCSQHNAIRAQPRWGPNINGGSITQVSAVLYFAACSVDATVGSASITTMNYFGAFSPILTAGGTIGTLNVFDIANITGPTTIRGINSAMNNGTFINHTGTAPSSFAGDLRLLDNVNLTLGTGLDATINYDGTNLIIDPNVVGIGRVLIGATGDDDMLLNTIEIDGDLNHDGTLVGLYGVTPAVQSGTYTLNATVVEDRTLLASASATVTNNNNVLAALISDLQSRGFIG